MACFSSMCAGRLRNICILAMICLNIFSNAARFASSLPSTAAGSSNPQCAVGRMAGNHGKKKFKKKNFLFFFFFFFFYFFFFFCLFFFFFFFFVVWSLFPYCCVACKTRLPR